MFLPRKAFELGRLVVRTNAFFEVVFLGVMTLLILGFICSELTKILLHPNRGMAPHLHHICRIP